MNNDRERTWAIFVFVFLLSAAAALSQCGEASAQEVELAEVPSVDLDLADVVRLDPQARAPHGGYLIRPELLEAMGREIERLRFYRAEDVRTALARCEPSLEVERARATAAERFRELETGLWRLRAEELSLELAASRAEEGLEWFENPILWFAVGVVVAGAGGIAIAVGN